jgi:hypothetical protein
VAADVADRIVMARAKTQDHPPTGQLMDGRGPSAHGDRVAAIDDGDPHAQPHPARDRGQVAEQREWVAAGRLLAPEGVVAGILS